MYFELYNKQLKLYTQTTLPEAIYEYYIISIASSYGKLTSVLAFLAREMGQKLLEYQGKNKIYNLSKHFCWVCFQNKN